MLNNLFPCTLFTQISFTRPVAVNNPRRSLPDIPSDGVHSEGDIITYEPNGDNSSDLYATVEPYQNTGMHMHDCINNRRY